MNNVQISGGFPLGVLRGDVQLPLWDVKSFVGEVSTGWYHSSQRGEGHRCVEEAVLGEPRPFWGVHQWLNKRQHSISFHFFKRNLKVRVPQYCNATYVTLICICQFSA